MAIYTRTGDKGETGLLGGERTNKGSNQIMAIGAVDELNSHLGLSVAMLETVRLEVSGENARQIEIGLAVAQGQLQDVQRKLFEIGALLAKPAGESGIMNNESREESSDKLGVEVTDSGQARMTSQLETATLEQWIDEMETDLPELKNFILPGGGVIGAELMVGRTVCRRAEREMVRYYNNIKYKKLNIKNTNQKLNINPQLASDDPFETVMQPIMAYLNRLGDYLFVAGRWVNWLLKEEEVVWKQS